jgi:hypothetical protein
LFKDLINDLNDHSIVEPDIFLDVPFVPSDDRVIDTMLQLARPGARTSCMTWVVAMDALSSPPPKNTAAPA